MILNYRPQNYRDFRLPERFIDQFRDKQPNWGFGALSYVVYKRSYARLIPSENRTEEFWETVRRVVEGVYNVQKLHCLSSNLPWDNNKAQKSAQKMYTLIWEFKFLPPGRGLEHMGTPYMYKTGTPLRNCAFRSTQHINKNYSAPFIWTMDMLMLGAGVGFDTRGAGTVKIINPKRTSSIFIIEDSREGWIEAVNILLSAYTSSNISIPNFDYSQIRPKGAPIKTFGGIAPGPQPLIDLISSLDDLYSSYIDETVDSTLIVDTMNYIGKCVVSGGRRRTAEIALGSSDDKTFINLKLDREALESRRWASNNAIFAIIGMDYSYVSEATSENGEPGYQWLSTIQDYGRLVDPPNYKDSNALGVNPCGEMTLWDGETCNVLDLIPANHNSYEEFEQTCKYAYLYAKTVTLIPSHDSLTNAVEMRNRRIGLGHMGVIQAINKLGRRTYLGWCDKAYNYIQNLDKIYSDWLCIPKSIKTTTVKPNGTTALLVGATPGISYPQANYYIRRVRIEDTSPLIPALEKANYPIEPSLTEPNTLVVTFPIYTAAPKVLEDVSIWEQLNNAADLQKYWSDNQVSATVNFQPSEKHLIKEALVHYEDKLKGISFLPYSDHGYKQAPYETITKELYEELVKNILPIDFSIASGNTHSVDAEDKYCSGETCELDFSQIKN